MSVPCKHITKNDIFLLHQLHEYILPPLPTSFLSTFATHSSNKDLCMVLGEKNEDFPPYAQHATHPSTHSVTNLYPTQVGLRRRLRKRCDKQVLAEDRSDRHLPDAHARASMRGHKGSDAVQHTRLPSEPPRVHSSRQLCRMLQVSGSDSYHVNT